MWTNRTKADYIIVGYWTSWVRVTQSCLQYSMSYELDQVFTKHREYNTQRETDDEFAMLVVNTTINAIKNN